MSNIEEKNWELKDDVVSEEEIPNWQKVSRSVEVIEKDKQERAQKAGKEVNEVLNKYNCYINPMFIVNLNGVQPNVSIVAK